MTAAVDVAGTAGEPNNHGSSVGSVIEFRCTRGRTLVGNTTRKCLPNGNWSGKSARCDPVNCARPSTIENGRVIVINDSTLYGGAAEYHCVPGYVRIGPYLRKCMDDGQWSGTQPHCELTANEAHESSSLGTGLSIAAAIIVILLILIALVMLHRNTARPVKNTENVQAAESKEDQNASVMSYSSLENAATNSISSNRESATFNTFHPPDIGAVRHARNNEDRNRNRSMGNFVLK